MLRLTEPMTVFEVSDGSRDMRPYEPRKASDYIYISIQYVIWIIETVKSVVKVLLSFSSLFQILLVVINWK